MAFPNFYGRRLFSKCFIKGAKLPHEKQMLKILLSGFQHFQPKSTEKFDDELKFSTNNSLIRVNYEVSIIISTENGLEVYYEFKTISFFFVTILAIMVAAFFSNFTIYNLFIFSLLFFILFYGMNFLYINSSISRAIKSSVLFAEPGDLNYAEQIYQYHSFAHKSERCPACGKHSRLTDLVCKECGLLYVPYEYLLKYNITKYGQKESAYSYVPQKNYKITHVSLLEYYQANEKFKEFNIT